MTRSTTRRHQHARSIAAALLALTAVIVSAGPVSAAPTPATAAVTTGTPPRWAVDVDGGPITHDQRGFDVDRLGNSYVASGRVLQRKISPSGELVRTIEAQGAGTITAWGQTVSEDLDVTVVGYLEGTVTIGSPPNQTTLVGADSNTQFLIQFDRHGAVRWARTFGGGNDGVIRPAQLHQLGDRLLMNGQYIDTIEIDGHTLVQPATIGFDPSGLLAAFDATTGEAQWLTAIDLTADAVSDQVIPLFGAVDEDSFAVAGFAGTDVEVRGPGATTDAECSGLVPNGGCELLVVVDPETGDPTLARSLVMPADTLTLDSVAMVDDGYVVAGQRDDNTSATEPASFVDRLDAGGDQTWTLPIAGEMTVSGLASDGNGDVVAAGTFMGTVELGNPPGPTATATSLANVILFELDGTGTVQSLTTGGGTGPATTDAGRPGLRLGPDDEIVITGVHHLDATFGTGPGAVTLEGRGTYLASYRADTPPPGSTFHPITATRLLDSRTPTGGWNGKLVAGAPRELTVAGVIGLPAEATAVVLNLTATDVTDMTYLTAWPSGVQQPTASILNVVAGDTIANHATVQVGAEGTITLATAQGSMNVIADILGYYMPAGSMPLGDGYHTIEPVRVLDSRTATGGWNSSPLAAGAPRNLKVAGTNGIPSDATAVVLSITVTDTSNLTYLRVQPTGRAASNSNIAVNPGQTITNLVTSAVDTGGQLTFTNNTGTIDVVADVVGYYGHADGGAAFHPISPTRVLDSRIGTGGPATPWGPGTIRTVSTATIAPVGSITAVAANLTATDTTAMSLLTLYPSAPRPATSNLLFTPGQTIASAANTGVAPDGTVSLYNQLGTASLILDVDGYFVAPPAP